MKFILKKISSSMRYEERIKLTAFRSWESFERLTVTSVRQIFSQFSNPDQKWAKKYVNSVKKENLLEVYSQVISESRRRVFSQIRGDQK